MGDDIGWFNIGAYHQGIMASRTPNLDRLVKRGVAFDRAYMQGGLQGATCVPSRAMLLSGRPLFRVDERLRRDPTWPSAFGKSGYTTFVSGKWHNGPDSLPASFQIARSIFAGGMTDPMHAMLSDMAGGRLGPPRLAPKHACEVFADEAIRFLKGHTGGPFFCYVPFDAPHDPHVVPEDFPVQLPEGKDVFGSGGAVIVEPKEGEIIAGPLRGEEGIVVADCDLRAGLHAKRLFDAVGHYGRADVLEAPPRVAHPNDGAPARDTSAGAARDAIRP